MNEKDINAILDRLIEKTTKNLLTWKSMIYIDGSIKYETMISKPKIIITVIANKTVPYLYITANEHCLKIDYELFGIENPNNTVGAKMCELKYIIQDIAEKNIRKYLNRFDF